MLQGGLKQKIVDFISISQRMDKWNLFTVNDTSDLPMHVQASLGQYAQFGWWYAHISVNTPPQNIEIDVEGKEKDNYDNPSDHKMIKWHNCFDNLLKPYNLTNIGVYG